MVDIEFSLTEFEFAVRDLQWLKDHSREIYIDGDKRAVVAKDVDDYALEELENRGIKYRVIG